MGVLAYGDVGIVLKNKQQLLAYGSLTGLLFDSLILQSLKKVFLVILTSQKRSWSKYSKAFQVQSLELARNEDSQISLQNQTQE